MTEYPDAVYEGDDLGPDPAVLYAVPPEQREPRLPREDEAT